MGRAAILGGGADGYYTITLDTGTKKLADMLYEVELARGRLEVDIKEAETVVTDLIPATEVTRAELDAAIAEFISALALDKAARDAATSRVKEATRWYTMASIMLAQARNKVARLKLSLAAATKERTRLLAVAVRKDVNAWCVDLTENASGVVATVEIPGEPNRVLIAPKGRAPTVEDGQLMSRYVMKGPQAYFNAAILPGWQRWMPDYRSGIIEDIDADLDTCRVRIDATTSSAQGINVNEAPNPFTGEMTLFHVPISYMDCDSIAFEVGDHVVVQFVDRDWAQPTVIGFVSNPQPCGRIGYTFTADGLIIGMAPDINRNNLTWRGVVSWYYVERGPPYNDLQGPFPQLHYASGGWTSYTGQDSEFSFVAGVGTTPGNMDSDEAQNLTNFKSFAMRVQMGAQINSPEPIIYGLLVFLEDNTRGNPGMHIVITLAPGPNKCRLYSYLYSPETPPNHDTDYQKFFTWTAVPAIGGDVIFKMRVDLVDGRAKLTINKNVVAEVTYSIPTPSRSLGTVSIVNLNTFHVGQFDYPLARVDYWIAN